LKGKGTFKLDDDDFAILPPPPLLPFEPIDDEPEPAAFINTVSSPTTPLLPSSTSTSPSSGDDVAKRFFSGRPFKFGVCGADLLLGADIVEE
jgi:hypothetical protein